MSDTVDVLVVGAGISGLSSAKLLHEHGLDVKVLEARNRVGGRTYTRRDENTYKYVDLGGSYVGPSQNRILRLAKEYGIKTYKINDVGNYVFWHKGQRNCFNSTFPRFWNPLKWIDMNHLFRKIDSLLPEIPLDSPWTAPRAEEWDNMTYKEFLDQMCWTEHTKAMGCSFINANVAMEPGEVSLLWFLWYVKSCGGSKKIWEVDNGAQERKFVGGSMQISECMAKTLGSDKVLLNCAVNKITSEGGGVTVETCDGRTFKSKYIVVAIAPTLQMSIKFEPAFPAHRLQLIQRLPMGSCVKSQTWYKKAFWREKGLNGFGSSADGIEPVGNTVDDCRPGDPLSSMVGFVVADRAREFSVMSKEERKQATLECYSRIFDSQEAMNPVYYEDFDWNAEPYSGGCYTSTYPPGVMTKFGKEIRKPLGPVYFAGTETATYCTGYMDGAIQAGERAAREILCELGRIKDSEVWQEEPSSEEIINRPFETTFLERYCPSVGQSLMLLASVPVLGAVSWCIWKDPARMSYVKEFLTA